MFIKKINNVNPPADSPAHHTMFDPNAQAAPANQEQEVAATESAAQDNAMEVQESAGEGKSEE